MIKILFKKCLYPDPDTVGLLVFNGTFGTNSLYRARSTQEINP